MTDQKTEHHVLTVHVRGLRNALLVLFGGIAVSATLDREGEHWSHGIGADRGAHTLSSTS